MTDQPKTPPAETSRMGEPKAWLVKRYDNNGDWLETSVQLYKPSIGSTATTEFTALYAIETSRMGTVAGIPTSLFVPIQPTDEMIQAGVSEDETDDVYRDVRAIYQAMVKAVPEIGIPISKPALDTATVAAAMKDFEQFAAYNASKLYWKIWQDNGSAPTLYAGGFDGWRHGFGMKSFEPRPLLDLILVMKDALRSEVHPRA